MAIGSVGWRPDHQAALFLERLTDTTSRLRLLGPDGTDRSRLAQGSIEWADFVSGGVSWAQVTGTRGAVLVADRTGAGAHEVLSSSPVGHTRALAAPDGRNLLAATDRTSGRSLETWHTLWLVSVPDGAVRRLGDSITVAGPGWHQLGLFSANGEALAYNLGTELESAQTLIWHRPSGTTSGPFPARVADFTPDGSTAVLDDGTLVDTRTGSTHLSVAGMRPRFSVDGHYLLVSREESWFVIPVAGGPEMPLGGGWAWWALGSTGQPEGLCGRGLGDCGGI